MKFYPDRQVKSFNPAMHFLWLPLIASWTVYKTFGVSVAYIVVSLYLPTELSCGQHTCIVNSYMIHSKTKKARLRWEEKRTD